jgi:competence protein ComFC
MKRFLRKTMRRVRDFLADILFPRSCVLCGKEGDWICYDCLTAIEIVEYQYCPFCKTRVFQEGTCFKHRSKKLKGLFFATSYHDNTIQKLIKKYKYPPFLKELSFYFTFLIITYLLASENKIILKDKEDSLLVPIPLSKRKMKWRGFNQSQEIARQLSDYLNIPCCSENLVKTKKTLSQTGLKKKEREKNVRNSFKIKNHQLVDNKRIFLVDDVVTTGATMEEAARILKEAGAKEVWGIALARE